MATLVELCESGELVRLDPVLGSREMECRRVYMLPRFVVWLERDLHLVPNSWNISQDAPEQVDALFHQFCSGAALAAGPRFKCLNHLGEGVWELKTADVRIFGWFAARDCFVCCDGDSTAKIKENQLYRGYAQQAVRRRAEVDFSPPVFVSGTMPNDVISDCY